MPNIYDPTTDTTYVVLSVPDQRVLVQEFDGGERLRHVSWLDPTAAAELGALLISAATELTEWAGA
jgi:hypothetical protein